ncbi:MAG: ABC transporter substrate-binding protein [Anaerolineae bacterium]|nr:ABC transporter substrate-binding protein [Anaerolineae bacterium]
MRSSLLVLLGLFLMLPACSSDKGATWRRIQESGTVHIGVDPTYPPFATLHGETVVGIDADLGRALAADLGLEATFSFVGYDGLYDALATGQVDLLIAALVVRPEMTRDFAYSQPYFNAGEVLVVPRQENGLSGIGEMAGKRLAVELGAEGHVIATQWQRRLANLDVEPYETAGEAVQAVRAGAADAAIVDAISAALDAPPDLAIAGEPLSEKPFAIVFRIEDEQLQEAVGDSLQRLARDGTLDAILARWLGGEDGS